MLGLLLIPNKGSGPFGFPKGVIKYLHHIQNEKLKLIPIPSITHKLYTVVAASSGWSRQSERIRNQTEISRITCHIWKQISLENYNIYIHVSSVMSLHEIFIEDFERQHWKIDKTVKTRLDSKKSTLITLYLLDFLLCHIVVGKNSPWYSSNPFSFWHEMVTLHLSYCNCSQNCFPIMFRVTEKIANILNFSGSSHVFK